MKGAIELCVRGTKKNLVEHEGVGHKGDAVEHVLLDPADVKPGGGADGGDLGGDPELRHGGDDVHLMLRGEQLSHHLRRERTEERRRQGQKTGWDERDQARAPPHQVSRKRAAEESRGRESRTWVACLKPWPVR